MIQMKMIFVVSKVQDTVTVTPHVQVVTFSLDILKASGGHSGPLCPLADK